MPHVTELVEQISSAKFISTLDLAKGYWQIPVASRDQPKTVFRTPWGLYKFVRMPFGLHGTAATFQRLMECILAPQTEYADAYIDDIVIFTQSWTQHQQALVAVLTELRKTGLTANPQKCSIAQKQTKYLGFLVGQRTIRLLADKVQAVNKFQAPQTYKQLQSFLGLTNYYRRFVLQFPELAAPLSEALKGPCKKGTKWTGEMMRSFPLLKKALCEDIVIHMPDFEKPFVLQPPLGQY